MSRIINWNDDYCPNGHKWVFCRSSTLYPDFYYCPVESKMWEPTVKKIDETKVMDTYNEGRPDAMKQYGEYELALEKLSYRKHTEVIELANISPETLEKLLESAKDSL